ncbi:MAG: nucleoside deaminase, partial [Bacteroidetes bacterium]|nr:nucleoside deaminase [Bacteroidota bacterium]
KMYFANTKTDAAKIGFDDEFIYKEFNLSLAQRKLPSKQICKEEAIQAFEEWELKSDKINY